MVWLSTLDLQWNILSKTIKILAKSLKVPLAASFFIKIKTKGKVLYNDKIGFIKLKEGKKL